jgi:hypothetical protein
MFAPSVFIGSYVTKNLVSYWSWREFAVLFTTAAVGAAVWLSGRALRPRLTLVPIFALYEALLNVMLFLVALRPVPNHSYWLAWSYGAIAENCLLVLLAIEITCVMLPAKAIAGAWSIGLSLLAILSISKSLPAQNNAAVLNVTLAGDFIAALVLLSLTYFRDLKWPTGYRLILAGVILPAAVHAASAIYWQRYELNALIQAALPLASLAGLVLFMVGQFRAKKERKKDYEEVMRRLAAASANKETSAATCSV